MAAQVEMISPQAAAFFDGLYGAWQYDAWGIVLAVVGVIVWAVRVEAMGYNNRRSINSVDNDLKDFRKNIEKQRGEDLEDFRRSEDRIGVILGTIQSDIKTLLLAVGAMKGPGQK